MEMIIAGAEQAACTYLNGWGSSWPARKWTTSHSTVSKLHHYSCRDAISDPICRANVAYKKYGAARRDNLQDCRASAVQRYPSGTSKHASPRCLESALRVTSFGYFISASSCAQTAVVVSLILAPADVLLTSIRTNYCKSCDNSFSLLAVDLH